LPALFVIEYNVHIVYASWSVTSERLDRARVFADSVVPIMVFS
jgi:hypothetical protein